MNNFSGSHMRSRRNLLDLNGFTPIHLPISNYSTDAQTKSDMKHTFGDDLLLNNLHLLSDPLKKNLADSVITGETKKKNMMETKEFTTNEAEKPPPSQRADYYPSLAGITNFFSGVFNVMGTIFQKRASSPASQYYDCFDKEYDDRQMAPPIFWQPPNYEVQNKNEQDMVFGSNNDSHTNLDVEMNVDFKTAATQCEEKLKQVRLLLDKKNNQNVQNSKTTKYSRRPRKAFIEAGSVEENFEDAFSPENFVSLPNDDFMEYCSPFNCYEELLIESDAPRIKTDLYVDNINESMDITKNLLIEKDQNETEINQKLNTNRSDDDITVTKTKDCIISSCEDKLSKLKALLQSKRCKSIIKEANTTEPIPIPSQNRIETIFGNEINSSDIQNSNNSQQGDYFNEVTGRFNSSSCDSEDSFQIVFSDSPQNFRRRKSSDCESEDSFIVFEESPDSCYTSNEVFGDDPDDSSDSDSNIDEDSGCGVTCKLSPNLSRTFGDLTDNSLYSQDVVDYSVSVSEDVPSVITEKTGLLLDETRKIEKKRLPAKKVHFSTLPPKVHVMRVWAFAARQARAGHWERHALDRERFRRRIADVEMAISWVLKPQHRSRVVFQRFMPWWNAQKRKEQAEKKEIAERKKERMKDQEDTGKSNGFVGNSENCDKDIVEENVGLHNDKRENIQDLSREVTINVAKDIVVNNTTEATQDIVNINTAETKNQISNDRDQNVLNTQSNDHDEIDDSNKNNDVSLITDLLIKDCCFDT